jgi:hypothetical protein
MRKLSPRFRAGMKPVEIDGCDWRFFDHEGRLRRGRAPAFWDYAIHSRCHWIANFNRKLAELVEPRRPWRIVTSRKLEVGGGSSLKGAPIGGLNAIRQ